jgi:hypothetical protein
METKTILNKTEKEPPTTPMTNEKPAPSNRPMVRRRSRRRLPSW